MKQINLFGAEMKPKENGKYTGKIQAPVYTPRGAKPHIVELCDRSKTNRLISEINQAEIPDDEKQFLIEAARRHTVFNYEKIADYYANSNAATQHLMERSALVIIDFDKAIQYGYVKLSEDISKQYLTEYGE